MNRVEYNNLREYRFENGYGATVINDGYGGDQGLFEVAVLDGATGKIIDNPITAGTGDQVIGWLTAEDVGSFLNDVAALPPRGQGGGSQCQRCKGDVPDGLHACAYQADVNNDPTPVCNCCAGCEADCAADI